MPKPHPVWKSQGGPVEKSPDGKHVVCKWKKDDGSESCKWTQKIPTNGYASTTNILYHVDTVHSRDLPGNYAKFAELMKKYKDAKEIKDQTGAMDMFVNHSPPKYKASSMKDAQRLKAINSALTGFVGTNPHVAYQLVEDKAFQELVHVLDPKFKLPCRQSVAKNVAHLGMQIVEWIAEQLRRQEPRSVNASLDMWTSPDGVPYMGVHVSHYDKEQKAIANYVVALEEFQGSHTAERIAKCFIKVWTEQLQIPLDRIQYIITDSASNCVKAFTVYYAKIAMDKYRNAQIEEEEEVEEEEVVDINPMVYQPFEEEAEEEDSSDEEDGLDEDGHDQFQKKLDEKLPNIRLRCWLHWIVRVVAAGKKIGPVRTSIRQWSAFAATIRGKQVGEELKKAAGITVTVYNKTRWTSEQLMMERLLAARRHLAPILDRANKTSLSPDDWELMRDFFDLLQPFSVFIERMQEETKPTIAYCVIYTICIRNHLAGYKINSSENNNRSVVNLFRENMLEDLSERFKYMLDPDFTEVEPMWAAAALLDPRTASMMPNNLKDLAKNYIIKELWHPEDQEEADEAEEEEGTRPEPHPKVSRADQLMEGLLGVAKKKKNASSDAQFDKNITNNEKTQRQLDKYMNDACRIDSHEDPIAWWVDQKRVAAFPKLIDYACKLICTPPTSSSIERAFSRCGKVVGKDRQRLGPPALRAETLITCNKSVVRKLKNN